MADNITEQDDFTSDDNTVQQDSSGAAGDSVTPPPEKSEGWKEALAELAGTVKAGMAPKPEAAPAPTQEQINEFWAVFDPQKVDEKFFHKFFGLGEDADELTLKEKRELFAKMQSGMMKQSVTATQNIIQRELAKMREEFAPIQQSLSEQKAEKVRSSFFKSYPALLSEKDDGSNRYDKILKVVAQDLAAKSFPDDKSYFKALAEGAAEAIQEYVPEFDLSAGKQKHTVTTPKLPRTSVGGTGGSGAQNGRKMAVAGASDDDFDSLDFSKA